MMELEIRKKAIDDLVSGYTPRKVEESNKKEKYKRKAYKIQKD